MNATIQTASQPDQLSIDAAQKLERFQFLENSTGEMDKKNSVEKEKRPEDVAGSLAALASAIWLRQPNDTKAQVTVQCELIAKPNSYSSEDRSREPEQSNELNSELTENSRLTSVSDITKNSAAKSAAMFSDDSSILDLGLQRIDEVATSDHDNVSVVGNADSHASKTSGEQLMSTNRPIDATGYREQNFNRPGGNSDLRVTSSNSAGRQHLARDHRSSAVDAELSGPADSSSKPDWAAKGDQSNSVNSSERHKFENEEAVDAAGSAPIIQQQFVYPEVIPNAHPQQFGGDLKRSAEQARAAMAAQKGSIEGVKYSFNSWGAGDYSVQITGSSRSGYKAQASNGEVAGILGKHLSEDNSLGLTIESTADAGGIEGLNIRPGEKTDQNNL